MSLAFLEGLFGSFQTDPIALKDFLLGFFIALALRRGRINAIIDKVFPTPEEQEATDTTDEAE